MKKVNLAVMLVFAFCLCIYYNVLLQEVMK